MLQTIVNAWKIADLRKKLLFTALIVLIFRIGSAIPVPFTAIAEEGIIKKTLDGVKILGNGEISKKLTVQANAFSDSAKAQIEAAGGKAEVI